MKRVAKIISTLILVMAFYNALSQEIEVVTDTMYFSKYLIEMPQFDSLTISNVGDAALEIFECYAGGPFHCEGLEDSVLEPFESTFLLVAFSPSVAGLFEDTLTIVSNDLINDTLYIMLNGQCAVRPMVTVEPGHLNFGQVQVGHSERLTLTLGNDGGTQGVIWLELIEGEGFSVDFENNIYLEPGDTSTFQVTFTPETQGIVTGRLILGANGPADMIVSLRGEGILQGVDINPNDLTLPETFCISKIYPNPFNPLTTITISLPEQSELLVRVFNIMGQKVAELVNGKHSAGYTKTIFNAAGLSSGIYFIHAFVPGKMNEIRKIVLMK